MTLREVASRPVETPWGRASRTFRNSRRESGYMMDAERAAMREPGATAVEKWTGRGAVIGQWLMQWPVALIAGAEELMARRK